MTNIPHVIPFASAVGTGPSGGMIGWEGLGAVILWMVFVTLVSAMLGILFDYVGGHSRPAHRPRGRSLEAIKHGV